MGISINKNMIPFDMRKPIDPSGHPLGTPALTTRGCTEEDMRTVVELMDAALMNREDEAKLLDIKENVRKFSLRFPVPGID